MQPTSPTMINRTRESVNNFMAISNTTSSGITFMNDPPNVSEQETQRNDPVQVQEPEPMSPSTPPALLVDGPLRVARPLMSRMPFLDLDNELEPPPALIVDGPLRPPEPLMNRMPFLDLENGIGPAPVNFDVFLPVNLLNQFNQTTLVPSLDEIKRRLTAIDCSAIVENNFECTICTCTCSSQKMFTAQCGHYFCIECISKWTQTRISYGIISGGPLECTCAYCRQVYYTHHL